MEKDTFIPHSLSPNLHLCLFIGERHCSTHTLSVRICTCVCSVEKDTVRHCYSTLSQSESAPVSVMWINRVKKATHGQSEDHDRDLIYFIPCLLRSARSSELHVERGYFDPTSLMIQFDRVYVPLGVFSATIINTISQKLGVMREERKKNKVRFRIGRGADIVTLISRPKFIEIALVQSKSCNGSSTPALCSRVRSVIDSTLKTFREGVKVQRSHV